MAEAKIIDLQNISPSFSMLFGCLLINGERRIGRIPVRNLWLLMLYASELTRTKGVSEAALEDDVDDLPELVARLLANSVERRLRRNLTYGYRHRAAVQRRVRGRSRYP